MSACLEDLDADGNVEAVGIYGLGRVFSAGADINDFNRDHRANTGPLRDLFATLDGMSKPTVVAMHGVAFGAGLETALAAHFRIAQEATRIGLPEVTLGLLPGGGGTQRLPRLVGMPTAIDLITKGKTIDAQTALQIGLIDEVFEGDPEIAVANYAAQLVESQTSPRRARDMRLESFDPAIFEHAAKGLSAASHQNPGPVAALGCLSRAAELPFQEALAAEYEDFDGLVEHPLSQGLRHAFLSERLASKVRGLDKTVPASDVSEVAIVGAGTMGVGIALACVQAGLQTCLIDQSEIAIARARDTIANHFANRVKRGKLSLASAQKQQENLTFGDSYDLLSNADLIIEAVFEDLAVKQQVFTSVEDHANAEAILASNTSTLDLNQIAGFTKRPNRVVGMHFFSPANVMRLLEIVRGDQTSDRVLKTAMSFAKTIRKVGVVVGVCDGFVGNRIMEEYLRQCYFLLEEGALPHDLDHALESWGWAMGACKVMDLAGQDIGWAIRKRRAVEQPDRPYSKIPDILCEHGRFGRKTGKGYYLYPTGTRDILTDSTVDLMIVEHSDEIGLNRRSVTPEEIVERTLLAMINEGAKILEEEIAARPSDIDAIYLNGYGFGRSRGGPMFQADLMGIDQVLERLTHFAAGRQGWAFEPAPILARMKDQEISFSDLNQGLKLDAIT
ncbi:MAG: 3-hydroxyacyl-CoA dehydrogenase NAD-binding domain-containing protein [Pseudomonadota bacterium]